MDTNVRVNAANKVQAARRATKLSIEELAKRAGISITTIRRIESPDNPHRTQYDVAHAIANVLGVPMWRLFSAHELTPQGRPTHAGQQQTFHETTTVITAIIQTVTETIVTTPNVCCGIELPMSGACDYCSS